MLSKRFLAFTCILVYGLLSSLLVLFFLYHPLLKGIIKDTLNKKEPNLATYLTERRTGLVRDEMVNNSQRTVSCGMGTDLKNQSSIWNLEEVVCNAVSPTKKCKLSYDVASGSEITPCNKIYKPQVVYRFLGSVMTSITTLRT